MLIANTNMMYITSKKMGTPSQRLRITRSSTSVRRFGNASLALLTASQIVAIDW
ncbi:hypothetical protein D3C81_2037940 [compost metagenome]